MFLKKNDASGGVPLQEDIMRFEGRFSSRLAMAFKPLLESDRAAVRLRAARDELEFMSAALDIAVGATPEVDLLDMVTLVSLGRDAMVKRWSADIYGDAGRGVADAFQASFDDISEVAESVVSYGLESQLRTVIEEWKAENPNQEDVASVRLSAYAERGDTAKPGFARDAFGLFSVVRGAAKTADTALLLGERALYAVQRLPFLIRMHARIGSTELLTDFGQNVRSFELPLPENTQALAARVQRSTNTMFLKAFLFCGGVSVVTAMSWLVARVAHHRLTRR